MLALLRYLAKRALFLGITLVISTFMVVLIANQGGLIDRILIEEIRLGLIQELNADAGYRRLNETQRAAVFDQILADRIHQRGLDQPFVAKVFRQTWDALTLNLGDSQGRPGAYGVSSQEVPVIILDKLPRTILLFTTATVLSTIIGVWLGLWMARRALSKFDRSMTVFSLTTLVIPSWVFGIFFILVFAFGLRFAPTGGEVSVPVPSDPGELFVDRLYHLALPLFTVTFSTFGAWSYTTRNLVLQIMSEDFVVAARSKGLAEKTVLRRYVLRAASPPIVTGIVLALISSWTGAIITEIVFGWPGLGWLFLQAISNNDAPTIIGITIVYGYLFVVTVLLLDIVYGLLDPRIRALGK